MFDRLVGADSPSRGYVPGFGAKQMPQIFMHKGDMFDFSAGDLSNRGRTILSVLKVGFSGLSFC
jgi:hypothetical protein